MTRLYKLLVVMTLGLWLAVFPMAAHAQNSSTTYTWSKPAKINTFNAITNNPAIGDERNFLLVRPFSSSSYSYGLNVSDGQEIVLMAYYDNDAASNYNLTAKNTSIKFNIPSQSAKNITVSATISSANSKPKTLSDNANLTASSNFSLKYESGSAQIWNNYLRGNELPDSIMGAGTLLGTDRLDGRIPGGSMSSGYVTIKAKVQFAKTSASTGSVGVVNGVPNTGPGQTVLIFLVASLVGAIAHRILVIQKRQT